MLDATQTLEPGVRRWLYCMLSGAARAPRTPKAQTHLFFSALAPLPSNNTQKFHWVGARPDPFLEPTHLAEGSLRRCRLLLLT